MKLLQKLSISRFVATLMVLCGLFFTSIAAAHEVPGNLVVNGELETANADNSAPEGFHFNQWGSLTVEKSYGQSADSEGKATHVKVSDYSDGDAKWYFNPINVTAGQEYVYSNRYKATANSEVVIQYQDASDAPRYEWQGTLNPTNTWTEAEFKFTVPAGVTRMTVFHVMAQNGELWTDDYAVQKPVVVPPQGDNLIANPSAELSGTPSTMPAAWHTNSWGSLSATFKWDTAAAKDGTKSMYTKVTNYQSGDAKWFFDPATVKPSTAYVFKDFYKGTASSEIVAQFTATNGAVSYHWLGSNAANSEWLANEYPVTTKPDTAKVSVFHVLASNGELWVDGYSLTEKPAAPVVEIQNPSVETPATNNTALPAGWQQNKWGSSSVQFEYLQTGHTGNRSVKTTVSNYVDGDAKWFFDPVKLNPGTDYRFSNYYQSNTSSRIIVAVETTEGTTAYYELPGATPSTTWKLYSATFTMPTNGVKATVYHMLSANGYLVTDDYSFAEYTPTGFTRGLVTLTFDDGWEENIDTAIPLMDRYGVKSNQFYATTFIQNSDEQDPIGTINAIKNKGHEMGSHTITHPDLTKVSGAQLTRELRDSKSYLQTVLGVPINYFATPYGAYNAPVMTEINKYYTVHRTVDAGYNSKDNFDQTRLKVQNVLNTTSAAEVQQWVDKAYEERTWLILVLHRVANDPGPYDTTPALFEQQLEVIKNKGIPVRTITQVLNELKPQL
jgi:peptidoglycan/xylan/chitin deacetylase (PgdA/CDA1 family)